MKVVFIFFKRKNLNQQTYVILYSNRNIIECGKLNDNI